jgi:DNA-binding response OmpR family regulator
VSAPPARGGEPGLDILVIEDDRLVQDTIKFGWPVQTDRLRFLSTYRQSLSIIHSAEIQLYDGVFLDINLPDGDGLTILRTIRAGTDVPIILISGTGSGTSRAEAIDLGADDYVMKPFVVRELQARMSRLVKVRQAARAPAVRDRFPIGAVECDLKTLTLSGAGRSERITDTEGRLLDFLHAHLNRNCGKAELFKHVLFRAYDANDKTLEVYVSRVRKKLADLDAAAADMLQTVRGFGYRLAGD